ncbi:MAG: hypothetical protein NW201_13555 [Gemmatimonadales bacterium]|nr:hypothetical protein [Gemmatimonadales bacterium]
MRAISPSASLAGVVSLVVASGLAAQAAPPPVAPPPAAARAPEVRVTGQLLLHGFWNGDRVNNTDVPTIALPAAAPGGLPDENVGGALRQTRLGVNAFLEGFAGGNLRAEVDVDFFGGQQPSSGGRTFPLLRLRRAVMEQRWQHVHVLVGQEGPPVLDVNPSSLAAIGTPLAASAGNLWLWLPQVRVTGLTGEPGTVRVGVEGAVLAPTAGEPVDAFNVQPDRAERSARPYLQARALVRWGEGDDAGELSLGGHLGWLAVAGGRRVPSRAAAVSVRAPLGRLVELRGEAFTGQALAGLGGGGIGQNLTVADSALRTTAGWVQLLVRPTRAWEAGAIVGTDRPDVAAAPAPGQRPTADRIRNTVIGGHVHWRPEPVLVGLEARRIETRYLGAPGLRSALQVSVVAGIVF